MIFEFGIEGQLFRAIDRELADVKELLDMIFPESWAA